MNGTAYGVGVGPGDPELITKKAERILKACPVIYVPRTHSTVTAAYDIAAKAVPELAMKTRVYADVPMARPRACAEQAYETIARSLMEHLAQGSDVAFLTLGDPSIYSTYAHIHARLLAAGYASVLVEGIPSFCAAAAALNRPLVTGYEPLYVCGSPDDLPEELARAGTKVYMKSASRLREALAAIQEAGKEACLVQNVGMRNQKIYQNANQAAPESSYYSIVIVN